MLAYTAKLMLSFEQDSVPLESHLPYNYTTLLTPIQLSTFEFFPNDKSSSITPQKDEEKGSGILSPFLEEIFPKQFEAL